MDELDRQGEPEEVVVEEVLTMSQWLGQVGSTLGLVISPSWFTPARNVSSECGTPQLLRTETVAHQPVSHVREDDADGER